MLKRLPQSIGNVQNLIILDLSYNKLLYLPVAIIHLNLRYLDISMNPFQIHDYHVHRIGVQSLFKLSANIVLQYRFVVSFIHMHARMRAHTLSLIILLHNFLFK